MSATPHDSRTELRDVTGSFALPGLPQRWLRDFVIITTLCVSSRLLVLLMFHLRGQVMPYMDTGGYIAQAQWLFTHGTLNIPEYAGVRFFHGVPLLLAFAARFTGEFLVTGLALNLVLTAGACALFYRNFPRLGWACAFAVLLPGWVSMTSTLHGECALWCLCLLGALALRLPVEDRRRLPLLLIAGFAMVCRPTAFLILLPGFIVAWWPNRATSLPRMCVEGLTLGAFPIAMALWSWGETGVIFVQSEPQKNVFAMWAKHWGGGFPETLFTWPGASLTTALLAKQVNLPIKLLNLAHVGALAGAWACVARGLLANKSDSLAWWLMLGLTFNGVFVLSHGGPFGGTIFYRFLATQANAFVLLAWLRHARLPPVVWMTFGALSIIATCFASRQA